ncbi:MAG: hypothetical protein ACLQHS_14705 [Candidatus Limnocylindrales bacterium]
MDQQLAGAIRERRMIEFDYGGHHRVAEPHVYGRNGAVEELLVYQVAGGSSSGGLPQWRRVEVGRMTGMSILEDTFPGPRPNPSGQHSSWDEIYEIVR